MRTIDHQMPCGGWTCRRARPFTAIEMLTVISIIGILASILLPALNKAREHALQVACANNMRQIALGYKCYMRDYGNKFPPVVSFLDDLSPAYTYTRSLRVFRCPSVTRRAPNIFPDRQTAIVSQGKDLTSLSQLKPTPDGGNKTKPGMAYFYVCPGSIQDIEKNGNANNGFGNNVYKFDPSNPQAAAYLAACPKKTDKMIYDKHYFIHFRRMNVVYIDDQHAETDSGVANYWTLDNNGNIDWKSANPAYPEITAGVNLGPP